MDVIAEAWKSFIWIRMVEDREKWRAFVNRVMILGFHGMRGILN
jgi:hypothetical protein